MNIVGAAFVLPDRLRRRFGITGPVGTAAAQALLRPVPVVTAQTLAVCRIFFGAGLLYFMFLRSTPAIFESFARSNHRYHISALIDGHSGLLTLISTKPAVCVYLFWTIGALILAFTVGLWSRVLYPVLVGLMWLAALLSNRGHFITPLLLAMTATLIAPWSAAWSLDALFRRRRDRGHVASQYYGYPIWLLGLVIGLTYAAAGLSKLILTRGAWLWDTGARNGFIQDITIAATDWGIALSNSYVLSVGASILSALGQAVYVYACFTRRTSIKFSIGAFIALPFLIGLVLFMGLFWWPWALLVLILYLPWRWIDRRITGGSALRVPFSGGATIERQRTWFLTAATVLILVHTYAVLSKTEYEPIYSNYPMYADRMRAGSAHEAEFWSRFKPQARHYRVLVGVMAADGTAADWSNAYAIAENLSRHDFWVPGIVRFAPREVLAIAQRNEAIPPVLCAQLRGLATELKGVHPATALQFAKRYIEISDGRIDWAPVSSWIEVDLTAPDCPHRIQNGLLR